MRIIYCIGLCLLFCNAVYGQNKFKVEAIETGKWRKIYCLIDEKGNQIKQLDSALYQHTFDLDEYVYFAVFSKKGSGWVAIDEHENELFHVPNPVVDDWAPDYLVENKIRIIDKKNKIGFANEKGEIIITPQFDIATSFNNGKAIIGQRCKKVHWEKHRKKDDCDHYSIVCHLNGYINENGTILKLGDYQFEDLIKEIDWKGSN